MKKLIALLIAAMALVGCSSAPAKPSETPAGTAGTTGGAAKEVNVGVSIYKFDDNFMTLYRNEIQSYFDSLSNDQVKYNVTIQDGKNDQAEQTNQIDNFIAQDYDVLIINLVQSTSAATVIEKCKEANKPCIFINREPSEEDMNMYRDADGKATDPYADMYTYVGADARQSGKFQGEIIADLENKGDLNGDGVLQYVMVVGDPENVDAKYRTEFSISQYKESSGLGVEKLDEQRGDWDQAKGQEIVANALTKYGDKVEVVFCNNDGMALGAAQAIAAANRTVGKDIYLVGVDALAEAVELVSTGGMTGTVLNDHIGQSHQAVDAAIKAVNGEKLDTYYWVDYVKVTPANAAEFK
ncbi:MAG: galactose ABC transporter substrate-binding protein [Anaerorhabdus sp.]|uniref:galactose ABC transporter substrate-binding protein n=1 Tax=Anaerorhabdus sp. TaxID=1872524 RepID=UPI002B21CDCA|nr:galactose ABC transporter substrate-binding protein [Anaerorhabdus sp.]MEA4875085.1 galactose ABC transporter substrate-binding protein [Anaerorhabdus sp.]